MFTRLKSLLAALSLSLSLLFSASTTDAQIGTSNVQPFRIQAWQIGVQSNYYLYPVGAGANWQYILLGSNLTNVNVQAALNWIDSNWVYVTSQILSTNGWVFLMPTQATVQATFNWIDGHLSTNYISSSTGSNFFWSITNYFYRGENPSNFISGSQGTQSFYLVSNPSNFTTRKDASNAINSLSQLGSFIYSPADYGGTYSKWTSTVPKMVDGLNVEHDSPLFTLSSGQTITINSSATYMVRGEWHLVGADRLFRDANKEVYFFRDGVRVINLGTADSQNTVLTGFGYLSLTNGSYLQLFAHYAMFTNAASTILVATSDYARIDIHPIGVAK